MSGRLYAADMQNHRVLSWPNAAMFTNGQAADIVIGQANFTGNQPNQGNATPSATSLNIPAGVTVDSQGSVFVSDSGNGRVLIYTPPLTSGMAASRVVGQPDFVTSNPPVLGANRIGLPTGIAVDNSGNLYVADYRYHRVLEFDAVLAGDGIADRVFGHANFNNTDIRTTYALNGPSAIALDSMGNLYIADEIDNRVLEYDAPLLNDTYPDRVFGQPSFFSTGRNNGGIGATTLDTPLGLALDDNDTLYIADTDNHRILVYDTPLIADTIADRVFGQPDFTSSVVNNGGISASSLGFPYSVAIGQGGDVYVADTGNHRLLAFDKPIADPALAIARMSADEIAAGGPAFTLIVDGTGFASGATVRWNGSARPTTMQSSTQLAAQIGTADIAAQGAASVTVANPAGGISAPRTIDLYIPTPFDTVADRVIGQPNRRSGTPNYWGTSAPSLDQPFNIAIHPGSGRIFVPDTFNHRVLSWANAYALTNGQAADLVIGQPDFNTNDPNQGGMVSAATLNAPIGVDVDAKGNLYVADAFNHRVLEYDAPLSSGMAADRVFGQPDFTSNTANNSGVSASSLGVVFNVLVDPAGNLYVADGARVLEYDTPLSNDTIADHVFGQPDFTSNAPNNGGVSATSLSSVNGLASDSASNLYIADTSNHRVLEYAAPLSSDSVADRVFGQPDFTSNAMNNGGVGAGTLAYPYDVEVDRAGNLYIADTNNNRVLQFDAPLIGDTIADRIFGQPDFATTIASNSTSATNLTRPTGIAVDGVGNVYIADIFSNRIVEYDSPIADPTLAIASTNPAIATAGAGPLTLTVYGANFADGATVRWGGLPRPTTFVSSTQLLAQIGTADLRSTGVVSLTVTNPPPVGGISSAYSFAVANPLPVIGELSRTSAWAGENSFALVVMGTGFVEGSVVRWNGQDRPTTVLSGTQVVAQVSAGDVASAGSASVSVFNPAPGGGISNPQPFTIQAYRRVYLPVVIR